MGRLTCSEQLYAILDSYSPIVPASLHLESVFRKQRVPKAIHEDFLEGEPAFCVMA